MGTQPKTKLSKKKKSRPSKHDSLVHQASKGLIRKAKTVKTFLLRKAIRKLKLLPADDPKRAKIEDYISSMKVTYSEYQ
jgi:hypothetical protein